MTLKRGTEGRREKKKKGGGRRDKSGKREEEPKGGGKRKNAIIEKACTSFKCQSGRANALSARNYPWILVKMEGG